MRNVCFTNVSAGRVVSDSDLHSALTQSVDAQAERFGCVENGFAGRRLVRLVGLLLLEAKLVGDLDGLHQQHVFVALFARLASGSGHCLDEENRTYSGHSFLKITSLVYF